MQVMIVMFVYMFLLIAWGVYQGRKVKSSSDYSIANRKLPGWVASLSERSTGESSWALLGLPGAAYATGLFEVWTAVGCALGSILAWIILAGRIRREAELFQVETFTDYIAQRHGQLGNWIRVVASLTIVFFFFFYVGAQFIGGAKTLTNLFGWNTIGGMLFIAVLVVPYTIYGGFRSVTYTDVIQAIIMIITLIVAPVAGLYYLSAQPEGSVFAHSIGEALSKAGPAYSTLLGGAGPKDGSELLAWLNAVFPHAGNLANGLGTGIIIAGAFSWFFGYLGGQPQLTMRFMAIENEKQARIGRNIGVAWTVIAYIGALSIGWIGIALFGPNQLADVETVMPEVLTTVFHPVVAGILITGVLAAIISTANSLLILSSTELSENIIKPLRTKKFDALTQSRWITAILSGIALVMAYFSPTQLVFDIVSYVWAGIGSTFSVVILLTLFWKRFSAYAALATIVSGLIFTVAWISSGLDAVVSARLLTFVVAVIVSVVASYIAPTQKKQH